jgi:DNA-binding NtrC family response regulator
MLIPIMGKLHRPDRAIFLSQDQGSGGFRRQKMAPDGPAKIQRKATILIVDDNGGMLKALERLIQRGGNTPVCASDGKEALEIFGKGGIDLVVSDKDMPIMGGLELLKELRKRDPRVKFIAVSGDLGDKDSIAFFDEGAIGVMRKPYDNKLLSSLIGGALRNGDDPKVHTPAMGQVRVLIVDDTEQCRAVGEMMVRRMGYAPVLAEDGIQGLAEYRKGGFDIVLTDQEMPGMEGLQMLKEIMRLNPEAKVIATSGAFTEEMKDNFYAAGASAVLEKPFSLSDLRKVVEGCLGTW